MRTEEGFAACYQAVPANHFASAGKQSLINLFLVGAAQVKANRHGHRLGGIRNDQIYALNHPWR